jgi:hypothetical protein
MTRRNVPTCGFTNAQSSKHRVTRGILCLATSTCTVTRRTQIFIGCFNCNKSSPIWRCNYCYSKFATKINNDKLYKCMVTIDVLQFMLSFNWMSIKQENIPHLAETHDQWFRLIKPNWQPAKEGNNNFCLVWKDCCPCCYKFSFEKQIDNLMQGTILEQFLPHKFPRIYRHRFQCMELNENKLTFQKETNTVVVVILNPVLTKELEEKFRYRSSDELIMNPFLSIEDDIIANYDFELQDHDWLLVLGNQNHGSSVKENMNVLSLKRIGVLNKYVNLDSGNIMKNISKTIATIAANSLPEKRSDKLNIQNNNCSRILKKNILNVRKQTGDITSVALTTLRSGGPQGNAGGMNMDELSEKLFSGKVLKGIPRTITGTIIVPYYVSQNNLLVNRLQPFYVSVKEKPAEEMTIVSPPNCAIPQYGYIAEYDKFWNSFENNEFIRYNKISKQHLNKVKLIIQAEACNLVNGCYVLKELCNLFPDRYIIEKQIYNVGIQKFQEINKDACNDTKTCIDNLSRTGRLSMVNYRVCGHSDNYTGKANQNNVVEMNKCETLESKFVIPLGAQCKNNDVSYINIYEKDRKIIPTGCLGYPMYMVHTNCKPLCDIEYHHLTNIIHLVGNNCNSTHRGCVVTMDGEKILFPFGASVTRMI